MSNPGVFKRVLLKIGHFYRLASSSLRWRLLMLSMAPLALFALIWLTYALLQRERDLGLQAQQRAQLLARQMAAASDYVIFSQNTIALKTITTSVASEAEVIAAAVYDENLQALSLSTGQQALNEADKMHWLREMQIVKQTGQAQTLNIQDRSLLYIQPIVSTDLGVEEVDSGDKPPSLAKARGYAIVQLSLDAIQTELSLFLGLALVVFVSFLLIAWSIVSRFSNQLDRRFRTLADAAKKIGAGQTNTRLARSDIKVFDSLASDLNRMAEKLEHAQSNLERQVEGATQALREQIVAAEKANNAKSRFLAAASHDLRQPMHALSLLVSAAQRVTEPQAKSVILKRIETGTAALSDLLNSLLDISRLDGGGVKVHQESFALDGLMRRLQDTYRDLAFEKGVQLILRPTKACTRTDPALLERIMGNLLSNAIRYTPMGGTVYVAVRPRGQDWLIQVRDNGPGIALADQEMIFHEFVQLSNPQRDRSQGLGLGLAIVQRLAQLQGHHIYVRSQPGQGATFALRIPRITASKVATASAETAKSNTPLQLKGLPILMVEDDELVRQSFAGLLGMWGANVDAFEEADAALNHIQTQQVQPQLIIADHRLAGPINGLELVYAVARQLNRPIPALLITGDTEDLTLQRLSEPHIEVLYKPVKPNVLIATINRLLSLAPGETARQMLKLEIEDKQQASV